MSASILVLTLVVTAAVAAVSVVVWSQYRTAPKPTVRRAPQRAKSSSGARKADVTVLHPFRATAIKPGKDACTAAIELKGVRYLVTAGAIPPLPLSGCDAASCRCSYVKYRDRRDSEGDRRAIGGVHRALLVQQDVGERRIGRGRRTDDAAGMAP